MDKRSRKKGTARRPARGARGAMGRGKIILLVDDDADWRLLVRDVLAQSEIAAQVRLEVHEAPDGEAALQYLFRQGGRSGPALPDLIYLDCEMPRLDGVTLLEVIRRDPRLRHIPTIMLTGVADEAEMRRASERGASAYIVKPPEASELARVLQASAGYWLRKPDTNGSMGQAA
jgi:CheY-like chemotaxis protein